MKNQFTSARITLTIFYTLTIVLISGVISGMFYYRTSKVIEAEYNRIERRIQMDMDGMVPPPPGRPILRRIQPEDLEHAKQQIVIQLLRINGLIVLVVAAAGYILSGLTLKPIQQSMEDQRRFVGDAAHELRTPITALKTSIEVNLMDKKMDASTRKILHENLDDVVHLEHLTNSLLKLSKFNDQRLGLVPVDLAEVVQKAVKRISAVSNKKHVKINVEGTPTEVRVKGDEAALVDLMVVLLDNAVKYSPQKSEVTIEVVKHQKTAELFVKDQGIGISKEHIQHVFDRFYQADPSRSKDGEGGYGLGLAVASKIVEQHHGLISVKSVAGKGSTFKVSLPLV